MGNGEAKELICTTHGHELRWGNVGGRGGAVWRGDKGDKKWDNCNSVINNIYIFLKSNWEKNIAVKGKKGLHWLKIGKEIRQTAQ